MNPVLVQMEIQSNNREFSMVVDENRLIYSLESNEKIETKGHLPWYEGEYTVSPRKVEQVLETDNKSLHDNVTIEAIHYSSVLNPSGGQTVNIGFE